MVKALMDSIYHEIHFSPNHASRESHLLKKDVLSRALPPLKSKLIKIQFLTCLAFDKKKKSSLMTFINFS